VFHCPLRNGRVALMASVTGLLAVGLFGGIPGGQVRPPRSGLGFFTDADGRVLASFPALYSRAQLSEMAGLLEVDRA
jgi:hypothetical protein